MSVVTVPSKINRDIQNTQTILDNVWLFPTRGSIESSCWYQRGFRIDDKLKLTAWVKSQRATQHRSARPVIKKGIT